MNELKVFQNENFSVRTLKEDSEMWFVAKDVAQALEYSETSISQANNLFKIVPEIWKGHKRIMTLGGEQEMLCVTEQGLYFFLGRSDKPKALPYQMWIAGEVVPSIRETGSYEFKGKKEDFALRERELNVESAKILQSIVDKPAFPLSEESKAVLTHDIVKMLTGYEHFNMLPEVTEKWYSATDLGEKFGVTPNKIGRLATKYSLKPAQGEKNEYGRWIRSKSQYSAKEVPTFIYNENAVNRFKEVINDDQ